VHRGCGRVCAALRETASGYLLPRLGCVSAPPVPVLPDRPASGQRRDRNAQRGRRAFWDANPLHCFSQGFEWVAKPCIATYVPSLVPTSAPSTSAFCMDGACVCVSVRLAAPHFDFIFLCQTSTAALISPPELFTGTQPKLQPLLPPATRHYKQGRAADNLRSESTPPPP